jgi:hypothetical protein
MARSDVTSPLALRLRGWRPAVPAGANQHPAQPESTAAGVPLLSLGSLLLLPGWELPAGGRCCTSASTAGAPPISQAPLSSSQPPHRVGLLPMLRLPSSSWGVARWK